MTNDDVDARQLARLFAYHSWATRELIKFCQTLNPEQLGLQAAGTLGPVERALTHLVSSEQFYLRDLTGEDPPVWIESKIVPVDQLAACAADNAARWPAYLAKHLDPDDEFDTDWRGRNVLVIRWGSLIQAVVHGVEHRTHICTILGANGIEPPDISVGAYEDETARGSAAFDRSDPT